MSDDREKGEIILSILRIALGWLFMWPFFDKLFGLGFRTPAGGAVIDGVSPSSYVVYQTGGVFGDLFNSLAGNAFIDVLFMFALIAIGISLIFGIASKLGDVGRIVVLHNHVPDPSPSVGQSFDRLSHNLSVGHSGRLFPRRIQKAVVV